MATLNYGPSVLFYFDFFALMWLLVFCVFLTMVLVGLQCLVEAFPGLTTFSC